MAGGPTSEGIARALVHVARKLGDPPSRCRIGGRARWVVLWALAAAWPSRSPMRWAPALGVDPNVAAVMLGRARGMGWFDWRLVVEAMALMLSEAGE